MIVYFLRHASAGQSSLNKKKDEKRPLDKEGVLQSRYVGRLMAGLDVVVECVISSPLTRATQTASAVANELGYEGEIQIENALRPEATFEEFQTMLRKHQRSDAVMVVGHNPNLQEFLARTIGEGARGARVEMKKGSLAKVEMRGKSGTLAWLITPKIARQTHATLITSSRPKTERK